MFALFLPNFPTCTNWGTLCFVILFQKFQIANISFSKISYLFALPLHVFMSTRSVLRLFALIISLIFQNTHKHAARVETSHCTQRNYSFFSTRVEVNIIKAYSSKKKKLLINIPSSYQHYRDDSRILVFENVSVAEVSSHDQLMQ